MKYLGIRFGDDVRISKNTEIKRPALIEVGNHIAIDTGFYITTGLLIGNYCHISAYVSVIGGEKARLLVEDFCTISVGSKMICGTDRHLGYGLVGPIIPEPYKDELNLNPIHMQSFVNIGANAVIMPGVVLGEGTVVGACSLVTKSTEPWTIYTGIPAKPMKSRPSKKMKDYASSLGYK